MLRESRVAQVGVYKLLNGPCHAGALERALCNGLRIIRGSPSELGCVLLASGVGNASNASWMRP